jgi:ligand-binding sensor domain-containing protein
VGWQVLDASHGLRSRDILCLAPAADGSLLVGTDNSAGLAWFETSALCWQSYDLKPAQMPAPIVQALAQGPSGKLWIGTPRGLYCLDPDTATCRSYTVANGLPDDDITWLCHGPDECLWVGTARGLALITADECRSVAEVGGLIRGIATGRSGVPVLVLVDDMLWRLNWTDARRSQVRADQEVTGMRAVAFDKRGTAWVAGEQTLQQRLPNQVWIEKHSFGDSAPGAVTALAFDGKRLWCGNEEGLWVLTEQGLVKLEHSGELEVNAFAVDTAGRVWVGTSQGLWYMKDGRLYRFEYTLPANQVLALAPDSGGALWVGTSDGLARLCGDTPPACWGVENSGLADPCVRAIAPANGVIWIGTASGVSEFRPGEYV